MSLQSLEEKVFKGVSPIEYPELANELAVAYSAWESTLHRIDKDKTSYMKADKQLQEIVQKIIKEVHHEMEGK
jgi:hypothetical protein